MSFINIQNLTFSYDGSYDNLFEQVSIQIDTDWKLGLTGRNGRGKTTFLKLLLGSYEFSGSILSSVSFEYFPFNVADKTHNTIDIVDGICTDYPYWKLVRELNLLDVSEDVLYRSFDTLSNGEQTKILLAALFVKENRFLLIDEPTSHLDRNGRELVSQYLNGKSGFILVSHDRAFLDGCVDHILSINRNNIEIQQGNYSSWMQNKERQDHFELAEHEKLKKEIKKLTESAKEKADWSNKVEKSKYHTRIAGLRPDTGRIGHKAAKLMKRAKTIENRSQDAVEEKSKLLKNIEKCEELKLSQLAYFKDRLVTLRDISIAYGETSICKPVSFCIDKGDRIALSGRNGSGKSSIIKLICGEDIPYTGHLEKGSGLISSYVSQDTSFLGGSLTEYARRNDIDETLFKAILRKLDLSRVQFEKDIRDFSEGQKKKVLLAKSLCEKAHLLIWDEPLNFMDVIARKQLETLLLASKPTILFVEHDRIFCENIATKVITL